MVAAGGGGKEELLFNGMKFQSQKMENLQRFTVH